MDESDQYFRATLIARETVERLQREGQSADEAKRLVAAVINAEEFALMKVDKGVKPEWHVVKPTVYLGTCLCVCTL